MTRAEIARWTAAAILAAALPAAAADQGTLNCKITENGESASGTVAILKGGSEVASGTCGKALSVAAGDYQAVFRLDGALDGPSQERALTIKPGANDVSADFATGILEVRIQREGRRAAGMAVIRRGGKQIGTLGSGVAAHLSVGTYEVVARYRDQEKRFESVAITAAKRVELEAAF